MNVVSVVADDHFVDADETIAVRVGPGVGNREVCVERISRLLAVVVPRRGNPCRVILAER